MATDKPFLLFPRPAEVDRDTSRGGGKKIHVPSHARQTERLNPQFHQLQKTLNEQKMALQSSPVGTVYEEVLVLETVNGIEDFIRAVRQIQGMEWFGEIDEDDIPPDDDFFQDETRRSAPLSGRIYLVMVNQQAIQQLLSLWNRYSQDENYKFPHGQAKWKGLFKHLKNIRPWGVEDRISETGILENWKDSIQHGQQTVRLEAELWFRENLDNQKRSQNEYSKIIRNEGGKIITSSIVPEIAYHGLLAEVPSKAVQKVIERNYTELVRCNHVMYFRPVGQVGVKQPYYDKLGVSAPVEHEMPTGEPVVALLDGFPLENHDLLRGRLTVDDCNNWSNEYLAEERCHGTSMASLIIHGELDRNEKPLARPIYVRPILKPMRNNPGGRRDETIPDDELVVDLIHRAIKRMFDGELGQPAVAPLVKIINMSVGDFYRQFYNTMSPWAKLLDWLAVKYDILFVVSAGNHSDNIELDIPKKQFPQTSAENIEKATLKAVAQDLRNRRLLSPAESINSLTIGSLHQDSSELPPFDKRINPYQNTCLPSPISSMGAGFRRSVKPDIFIAGGRQLYEEDLRNNSPNMVIRISESAQAPGLKVAYPGTQGKTNSTCYTCGTSNSAALISRLAGRLHDLLLELREEKNGDILQERFFAVLLKTMLVHGCSWGDAFGILESVLRDTSLDLTVFKEHAARFLGYGGINASRLECCEDHRVTIIGCGELSDGGAHLYEIPLPPSLISSTIHRRLIVTLGWNSPINCRSRKYRKASLWFSKPNGKLNIDQRANVNWQAAKRGTVQHEIFEGNRASVFSDGDTLVIKVNCKKDASEFEGNIPYGLAVSLEVAEGTGVSIYNEIRTKIPTMVRVTAASAEEK